MISCFEIDCNVGVGYLANEFLLCSFRVLMIQSNQITGSIRINEG